MESVVFSCIFVERAVEQNHRPIAIAGSQLLMHEGHTALPPTSWKASKPVCQLCANQCIEMRFRYFLAYLRAFYVVTKL